jgi:hypothetical protein
MGLIGPDCAVFSGLIGLLSQGDIVLVFEGGSDPAGGVAEGLFMQRSGG